MTGGVRRDEKRRPKRGKKAVCIYTHTQLVPLSFYFSLSIAHPYIHPFLFHLISFFKGVYTQCMCRVLEIYTHGSIDRVRWSLRWLAHTLRRLAIYRARTPPHMAEKRTSSLWKEKEKYWRRLTSSPRAFKLPWFRRDGVKKKERKRK